MPGSPLYYSGSTSGGPTQDCGQIHPSRPAATRTTLGCRTSSAGCQLAARRPAASGASQEVGGLDLAYEQLTLPAEPGVVLVVYTAEPGTPTAERLQLLSMLAADQDAGAELPR